MTGKTSHRWSPIEDLPEDWKSLANPQVEALVAAWHAQADELRQGPAYDHFLKRLRREWAIETGFIERLYRISENATKTLIEQGLDAALLLHEDVDRSPDEVIAIITDQYNALEGLYLFISGDRDLSKSYIRELHQVLTAHQPTYEAVNTLGHQVVADLPRGVWKSLPNNVGDRDGDYFFEFCPPEHVDTELEHMLRMHQDHEEAGIPPDVEAAWLHHRFTLIHPFTDGNGRVARCLASLVLLKAGWFPLVVTRNDGGYIGAIREADQGHLKPLIDLLGSLQSRAVTNAFRLGEELDKESKAISSILDAVKLKFERSRQEEESSKKKVLLLGDALQHVAAIRLAELEKQVHATIHGLDPGFQARFHEAGWHAANAEYHHFQIIEAVKLMDYFANFHSFQAWASLVIDMDSRSEILISFHGMGREFSGILAVAALFYSKQKSGADETIIGNVTPLSDNPFLFTYQEMENDVIGRFRPWLDERLRLGLVRWEESIGV